MTTMRHKRRLFNKHNRVLTIRMPQHLVEFLQKIPEHLIRRASRLAAKGKP